MRKLIPLVLILFCSCRHADNAKYKQLQDTLERLRKKTDFRTLDSAEAYDFINNYYVHVLDSLKLKRKLFIYPLVGKDFQVIYNCDAAHLKALYNNDTAFLNAHANPKLIPYEITIDKQHPWNKIRLSNINLITDTLMLALFENHWRLNNNEIEAWYKKFGYGYTCISYPLYNLHTKRLLIRQYSIHGIGAVDGNATESWLGFQKTPKGWQAAY